MNFSVSITSDSDLTALTRAQQAYGGPASTMTQAEFVQLLVSNQVAGFSNMYLKKSLTKLEFLNRFTPVERISIRAEAQTNPVVADYLAMLDAAQDVDLTDERTIGGAQGLEAMGKIGAGRAAEILVL